jgi:RNA polymerase sigma factor (sigma-70 family)
MPSGLFPALPHRNPHEHRSDADAMSPVAPRRTTGPANGRGRHDEYERFAQRFAELALLSEDHPRRRAVRAELITGYLPVARHIRVPRPIREVQFQLFEAADEMSQRMGRAPTPSELASRLELDLNTVVEALQAAYETRPSSLDEPHSDDDAHSAEPFGCIGALGAADPHLDLVEDRESLAPLLDGLPDREREIVLLRFYGNMTQTEIAQRIGISQMHVSRLLAATLAQLREQLNAEG